jgi:hypothetical protein
MFPDGVKVQERQAAGCTARREDRARVRAVPVGEDDEGAAPCS